MFFTSHSLQDIIFVIYYRLMITILWHSLYKSLYCSSFYFANRTLLFYMIFLFFFYRCLDSSSTQNSLRSCSEQPRRWHLTWLPSTSSEAETTDCLATLSGGGRVTCPSQTPSKTLPTLSPHNTSGKSLHSCMVTLVIISTLDCCFFSRSCLNYLILFKEYYVG